MEDILYNPVFNALLSGDRHLGFGTDSVKCFDEEVSPFAGFATDNSTGFQELYDLLPAGRRILYATPTPLNEPDGWEFRAQISGLQFVFPEGMVPATPAIMPVPLDESNVQEMIQLTALTKPGPFDKRTIEFGHYHGIFENGRLAAMTGQRMHVHQHTEISAVCTHPDFLGKGYAAALLLHQLHLILSQNQQPFLHVRDDNSRAIGLYERLGFSVNRPMNFYFMKKRT
ncbi:MAG: GNAT family N-acetyltransferase [Chitinophagaceae bacterium]